MELTRRPAGIGSSGTAVAREGCMVGEGGLDEGVGTPDAGGEFGEFCGGGKQPWVAAEEVTRGAVEGSVAGDGACGPEFIEEPGGETRGIGSFASLLEVCGVKMLGEGVGQEDDFEILPGLEAVAEFHVLHHPAGVAEALVEGVVAEELGLDGEIAGVEVPPFGGDSAEQIMIGELGTALVHPAHEGGDGLEGFAPAGETEARNFELGMLAMECDVGFGEAGGAKDVVADHDAERSVGKGDGAVAGTGGTGIWLAEKAEIQGGSGAEAVHLVGGCVGASVVDDDDFEGGEGLAFEAVEAEEQGVDTIEGGDDETCLKGCVRRLRDEFRFRHCYPSRLQQVALRPARRRRFSAD